MVSTMQKTEYLDALSLEKLREAKHSRVIEEKSRRKSFGSREISNIDKLDKFSKKSI